MLLNVGAKGISVFNFDENRIRTITDDNGDVWFVAKDVAESLGYRDALEMTRILDSDEVSATQICVAGQNRKVNLANESGVFYATFSSKKPKLNFSEDGSRKKSCQQFAKQANTKFRHNKSSLH